MHRAKAAYQLAAGNIEEALAEVHRAKFSFPKHLPYYEFEWTLLAQLHHKAIQVAELQKEARLATSKPHGQKDSRVTVKPQFMRSITTAYDECSGLVTTRNLGGKEYSNDSAG